jgi:hypothetical protein
MPGKHVETGNNRLLPNPSLSTSSSFLSTHISPCYKYLRQPGSSGSIVSDFRLDDRAIEVRSPAEAKDFSCSLCIQISSEAHPASYPMGTGGSPLPGVKRGRGVTLTTHSHPVLRSRRSRSYTSVPL